MKEIFDITTTDIPFYDNLLKNGKGFEIGNVEVTATIEYMTIDSYFNQCAVVNKSTVERQYKMISEANMQQLMNVIEYKKLPIVYLNYVNKGQEGRHRALLAKRVGMKLIPVLIIKKMKS